MFLLLLGVNGVGPKGALGLLSAFSAYELQMAIISHDAKTIAKAPGIGAKTAQRMILELKDKVSLEDTLEQMAGGVQEPVSFGELERSKAEAVEALTALGYSSAESMKAVKAVNMTEDMNSESLLKAALKHLF